MVGTVADTFCCAGAFPPSLFYSPRERALDGASLSIVRHGQDVVVGGVIIQQCDVTARNGVVQVLGEVLPEALRRYLAPPPPPSTHLSHWERVWTALHDMYN